MAQRNAPAIAQHRRLPRAVSSALVIGLSAASLAALLYVESHPFRPEVAHAREHAVTADAPVDAIRQEPTRTTHTHNRAPSRAPAPVVVTADDAEPVVGKATVRVRVPDLSGMRLSTARKTLRAAGLDIEPHDRWGDPIYSGTHRFYRVRSQEVAAGRELADGATVEVEAASIGFASGY